VLSRKLKDLEELGFLKRSVFEARPPRVRYSLSRKGETLVRLGEPVILYLRQSIE
jgi:DNA-binding HxlR family transcriptional regulator